MATLSKKVSIFSDGNVITQSFGNGGHPPIPPTPSKYRRLDTDLRVPDFGTFVQLRHWDEFEGKGDNKNEFPEMFNPSMGLELRESKDGIFNPKGQVYEYMELPDPWMEFQFKFWEWNSQYVLPHGEVEGIYQKPNNNRTFYKTTPGTVMDVYRDMGEAHRCFTEAGSREGGNRDPVMNVNMTAKKNVEWLADPTCGAMLKVSKVVGAQLDIEALDILKPPPTIEYVAKRPWLYFWCTQWGKYSGSTRFPQITNANRVHGLPEAGTASLLLSRGGVIRVRKTSTRPLVNGAIWTPYKPK